MSSSKIRLTLEGSFAAIRAPFIGDRWGEYRLAIEGAIFNKAKKCNYATLDKVPGILVRLRESDFPVECSGELVTALAEHTTQLWNDVQGAKERAKAFDEEMQRRINPKTGKPFYMYPFQYTGITWLSMKHGALLADDMGTGKLSGRSEPVMTPSGWRTMGDLGVGDHVIGSDGLPTRVTGIFPQGVKMLYRVTLTDGAWTRAGADHLWYVETPNTRIRKTRGRVMTTAELMRSGLRYEPSGLNRNEVTKPVARKRGNTKWFIPLVKPVCLLQRLLPIDPYLLGALLANGSLDKTTYHHGTDEQREEIRRVLPVGIILSHAPSQKECSWGLLSAGGPNTVTRVIASLGLQGSRAFTKHVPKEYLLGSVEQRLGLLQGLCDNDGCVSADGMHVEYNTVSPQLCADVLELVRSLGGVASVTKRIPVYEYKGEKLEGQMDHRINVILPDGFCPFRVHGKKERYKPRTKYPPTHGIESIEECGAEEAVCIRVEADDHLYVTRDYIVTHNTLQTIAALPANAATLVVGPAIAKGSWRKELSDWRPGLTRKLLEGRGTFRFPTPGEVVITNYDILPEVCTPQCIADRKSKEKIPGRHDEVCLKNQGNLYVPALQALARQCKGCLKRSKVAKDCKGCLPFLKDCPADVVLVADEAHNLKNPNAQRTVRFRGLSTAVRAKGGRVWLLTATPILNQPMELWSIFQSALIAQEVFGDFKTFLKLFDAKAASEHGGFEFGTPDSEAIAERMQRVMLRRMKKDVLQDLPPKDWRIVPVDIDAKTLRECDRFLSDHGGEGGIDGLVEKLGKSLAFETMSIVAKALAIAKIPAMLAMVEDFEAQEEPLVVFSKHRAPIDTLAKREGWGVITGDTSTEERVRLEAAFQAGDLKGLGLTIKAGGVAITLTYGCNGLFVDREWSPKINEQAEDRLSRISQTRPVLITILVANHPLDERVTELTIEKTQLIDASVDAARVMEQEGATGT